LLALVLVVVCSGVAACGSDDDDGAAATTAAPAAETTAPPVETSAPTTPEETTPATEPSAEAAQIDVQIDGNVDQYNGAFFAYFPDKVTVHPGDTVTYVSNFSGEPHSIAFGSVVTDAIDQFKKLTPEQLAGGEPPPEFQAALAKVPPMLPDGPGDAVQTSVNPCFVAEGEEIPEDTTKQCPVTEPEPFNGTETFYNSGFLPDGETFDVQIADDIKPGTYLAFCTLHFTEMISEVTVVPPAEPVPTADEVAAEAQQQLDDLAVTIAPALDDAKSAAVPGQVLAGFGTEDVSNVLAVEFVADTTMFL